MLSSGRQPNYDESWWHEAAGMQPRIGGLAKPWGSRQRADVHVLRLAIEQLAAFGEQELTLTTVLFAWWGVEQLGLFARSAVPNRDILLAERFFFGKIDGYHRTEELLGDKRRYES